MSASNLSTAAFERLPVLRPRLPTFERLEPYLRRIDGNRFYSNRGPLVVEFEARVGERLGVHSSIVTASSGTAALVGAILAVAGRATPQRPLALIPAFTFVATALAAELCGYRPFVCDVDPANWMLSSEHALVHPKLERFGVAICVAPFGRAFAQEPWRCFRECSGVPVVIDGAACFDVLAEDRDAARMGLADIPVALSFHATKSLATGEGGAVVTTDEQVLASVAQSLNLGFFGSRDCRVPAINGKLSEYHAAVGLAELDDWSGKRAAALHVARSYRRMALQAGLGDALLTAPTIAGCYVLLAAPSRSAAERVIAQLEAAGVGSRYWYGGGVHQHEHFGDVERDELPVAEDLASRLLGLPVAPDLDDGDVESIVAVVASALNA